MELINSIGGLLVLALALYETQNFVRACFFAYDWPDGVELSTTQVGFKLNKGCKLTVKTRVGMAFRRAAYCSLLLHEVHSKWHGTRPMFKTMASAQFGFAVALCAFVYEVPLKECCMLGMTSSALVFFASQARSLFRFYAFRVETDNQVSALLKSR